MIGKIVKSSIKGNKTHKFLNFFAISLACILISTMLNITLGISNEVTKELRSYGSNIIIIPSGGGLDIEVGSKIYSPFKDEVFLDESGLYQIKEIFWRNNITAFAPFLDTKVSLKNTTQTLIGTYFKKNVPIDGEPEYTTGVLDLYYFWEFEGRAVDDDSLNEVNIGEELAHNLSLKVGDTLLLNDEIYVKVVGIVKNSGNFSNKIISSLKLVQKITNKENLYARAEVSALTIPNDALAQKVRQSGLSSLDDLDQDKWMCSAYADTIAHQISEDYKGAKAKVLTKVADAESNVVDKIQSLLGVVSIICLAVSSIAVASLMSSDIFRRKKEIGLLKALGANNIQIYMIFASESVLVGIFAAIFGAFFGILLSQIIAYSIFYHTIEISFLVLPICIVFAILIALLGSFLPMKSVVKLLPAEVLYGRK